MIEVVMWLVAGASLYGTVLNIHKRRVCFYIWAGTNAAWTLYDVGKGAYPQAALQAVYFCLAIWGIAAWKERPK